MMRPDEVKQPNFTPVKGTGYDAYEVDEYVKSVYETYIKLLTSNKQYSEKFSSMSTMMDDYNDKKAALSDLLIESKANAQKVKTEAEKTAKEIVDAAREQEQELLASAKQTLENSQAKANEQYDEILAAANTKAKEIVDDANLKAAQIVSDAYEDAQKAKDATKKIVADANKTFAEIGEQLSGMKTLTSSIFGEIGTLLDSVEVPAELKINDETVDE